MDAGTGASVDSMTDGQTGGRTVTPTLRPATAADSRAVFEVFIESLIDFGERLEGRYHHGRRGGHRELWVKRAPIMTHAAETADKWWVAEEGGRVVGYARSTLRDGIRQLTEFFVRPEGAVGGCRTRTAGAGVPGRRSAGPNPARDPGHRAPWRDTSRPGCRRAFRSTTSAAHAASDPYRGDLEATPVTQRSVRPGPARLDRSRGARLPARRGSSLAAVQPPRALYTSETAARSGYGYVGLYQGPFATLDPAAIGAMLAHAESVAEVEEFGVEAPLINGSAVQYLLEHGFRMDPFVELLPERRGAWEVRSVPGDDTVAVHLRGLKVSRSRRSGNVAELFKSYSALRRADRGARARARRRRDRARVFRRAAGRSVRQRQRRRGAGGDGGPGALADSVRRRRRRPGRWPRPDQRDDARRFAPSWWRRASTLRRPSSAACGSPTARPIRTRPAKRAGGSSCGRC